MYFGLIKKYKEQFGFKMFAYSLMPNHTHLLMEVDEETTISTIMHNINSSYTKYYNGRYNRKGHLFRERFKAALIEKDPKVLLSLTAYIHLNPKKLQFAAQAQAYPYSSYALYLDYDQKNDYGLDIKEQIAAVLSGLINEDYGQYIQKAEQIIDFKKMHKQLQRKGVFGSQKFIEEVKKQIEQLKEQSKEQETQNENYTPQGKQVPKLGTIFLVLVLTAAGTYVYFNFERKPLENSPKQVIIEKVKETEKEDLNNTEWQLRLTSPDGKEITKDTISFSGGNFISANLSRQNYLTSKYSIIIQDGKTIWQTMQTSPNGTASWRGEVSKDKMSGILSLRQKGKQTQVFSFKSISYIKKMGGKR